MQFQLFPWTYRSCKVCQPIPQRNSRPWNQISSQNNEHIESFVQFPLDPTELQGPSDAYWGPQSSLIFSKAAPLPGQTYTARSSTQAKIGAVDECTKAILQIKNIPNDLKLFDRFHKGPITIYNDNQACVQWSHKMTTKGLCYIQMQENAVRESVQDRTITVDHIGGKKNPTDIFTKEDWKKAGWKQTRNFKLWWWGRSKRFIRKWSKQWWSHWKYCFPRPRRWWWWW